MSDVEEQWRPVRGYENEYQVSNLGQVQSVERFVRGRDGSARRLQGKLLTPRIRDDGTHAVNLWTKNHYKQIPIRRLVLEAFDRAQPRGFDGVNKNGNPADNRLSNLKWEPDRRLRGAAALRSVQERPR